MNSKKIWVILVVFFFLAGASGGFFLFKKLTLKEKPGATAGPAEDNVQPGTEEVIALRFYYPSDGRLVPVDKRVARKTRQLSMAGTVIEEYLKGPDNVKSFQFPQNVKLHGLYKDASQMLYVDLSDELRRNFQGDALSEYLLLRSIYESLVSNLQDIQDIKILIEGKEAETLGGHIYLKYPLKNTAANEYKGDSKVSDE
jgi:spore germination protein GerM